MDEIDDPVGNQTEDGDERECKDNEDVCKQVHVVEVEEVVMIREEVEWEEVVGLWHPEYREVGGKKDEVRKLPEEEEVHDKWMMVRKLPDDEEFDSNETMVHKLTDSDEMGCKDSEKGGECKHEKTNLEKEKMKEDIKQRYCLWHPEDYAVCGPPDVWPVPTPTPFPGPRPPIPPDVWPVPTPTPFPGPWPPFPPDPNREMKIAVMMIAVVFFLYGVWNVRRNMRLGRARPRASSVREALQKLSELEEKFGYYKSLGKDGISSVVRDYGILLEDMIEGMRDSSDSSLWMIDNADFRKELDTRLGKFRKFLNERGTDLPRPHGDHVKYGSLWSSEIEDEVEIVRLNNMFNVLKNRLNTVVRWVHLYQHHVNFRIRDSIANAKSRFMEARTMAALLSATMTERLYHDGIAITLIREQLGASFHLTSLPDDQCESIQLELKDVFSAPGNGNQMMLDFPAGLDEDTLERLRNDNEYAHNMKKRYDLEAWEENYSQKRESVLKEDETFNTRCHNSQKLDHSKILQLNELIINQIQWEIRLWDSLCFAVLVMAIGLWWAKDVQCKTNFNDCLENILTEFMKAMVGEEMVRPVVDNPEPSTHVQPPGSWYDWFRSNVSVVRKLLSLSLEGILSPEFKLFSEWTEQHLFGRYFLLARCLFVLSLRCGPSLVVEWFVYKLPFPSLIRRAIAEISMFVALCGLFYAPLARLFVKLSFDWLAVHCCSVAFWWFLGRMLHAMFSSRAEFAMRLLFMCSLLFSLFIAFGHDSKDLLVDSISAIRKHLN